VSPGRSGDLVLEGSALQRDHETTLRAFMNEWGKDFESVLAAFRRHLAPNAVWVQDPAPTTRTIDEALGLLRDTRERLGLETFAAEIRHIAVNGDVAFAERVDHLRRADGSLITSLPLIGVFEFDREGRITAWREYFDSASLMKALADAAGAP
jgi:limonene-1,2-epoxide hydrolase